MPGNVTTRNNSARNSAHKKSSTSCRAVRLEVDRSFAKFTAFRQYDQPNVANRLLRAMQQVASYHKPECFSDAERAEIAAGRLPSPLVARHYELSAIPGVNPTGHLVAMVPKTNVHNRRFSHVPVGKQRPRAFQYSSSTLSYILGLFGRDADLEELGSGAYGVAYLVNNPKEARRGLDTLRRTLSSKVTGTAPAASKGVVVKVVVMKPGGGNANAAWNAFVKENVHEAQVHAHLSRKDTCVRVKCSGVKVCPSSFVPKLHLAGADVRHGVFVSVMSMVSGMPLSQYGKTYPITADLYVKAEKAIVSLWLLGIAHCDLHMGNVFVSKTPRSGFKVSLIDFGFAVILPPDRRQAVQKAINSNPALAASLANAAWYAKNMIGEYTNKIMAARNFAFYNPDGKLLRLLWNQMEPAEREKVPALRNTAWQCGAAAPNRRKLTRSLAIRPRRQHLRWKTNPLV